MKSTSHFLAYFSANGRLKRLAGMSRALHDDERSERDKLEHKNRLLLQKVCICFASSIQEKFGVLQLKSLKHQLLVYTRPTAQTSTINQLTVRNEFANNSRHLAISFCRLATRQHAGHAAQSANTRAHRSRCRQAAQSL